MTLSRQNTKRGFGKSSNGGPVIPGWNKNDHNMIRILANYLKANVDYYKY